MKLIILFSVFFIITFQCFSKPKIYDTPKTVLIDRIILPKKSNTYMEVRHIVLKGSNVEIGNEIGKIAQSWLQIIPSSYSAPIFAKARNMYMLDNYPVMLDRMIGIGRAYNVLYSRTLLDLSTLSFDLSPFGCTAVYFPSIITKNRDSQIVRNFDSYVSTINELTGISPTAGARNIFSRNFIMELYPEAGYSSIVFGSSDLLNGVFDGLNSTGLTVCCMPQNDSLININIPLSRKETTGLYMLQLARLILDTCSNVNEAKVKILNAKISDIYSGIHMLVADKTGKSFIFEFSPKENKVHFFDNQSKAQILTNLPLSVYPTENSFPSTINAEVDNPFYRYKTVKKALKSKKGKFTQEQIWDLLNKVYIDTDNVSNDLKRIIPKRTLWKVLINQNTLSCKIIYYLNDGDEDKETGKKIINFSKPFTFNLGVLEKPDKDISPQNI